LLPEIKLVVCNHTPTRIPPAPEHSRGARPQEDPLPISQSHKRRPHGGELYQGKPVRASVRHHYHRVHMALCQVLHQVARRRRRQETITLRRHTGARHDRYVLGHHIAPGQTRATEMREKRQPQPRRWRNLLRQTPYTL